MSKIKYIYAQEILDSRGFPTIKTTVELSSGVSAAASVPSGASTGKHEAWELRDGGKRYKGQGVQKGITFIQEEISRRLHGSHVEDQHQIDALLRDLDGTPNKKRLGANTMLSVSLACARAAAAHNNMPLYKYLHRHYNFSSDSHFPRPMMNVLNGGRHADNGLSIQEFMIVPKGENFSEQVRIGAEVYHTLHELLVEKKLTTGLGDEGGFAPMLKTNAQALDLLIAAITKAKYKPGKHVDLAFDAAASEFYDKGKYVFERKRLTAAKLQDIYQEWITNYPIISIEDGFAEDDWKAWHKETSVLGDQELIVGDDLFVTNIERLKKGIIFGVANTILIKLNQIGTLSETIEVIKLAQEHAYQIIISHRSGETSDDFIADLAVATGAPFIKAGAPARGERVAKYNRLMEIEQEVM